MNTKANLLAALVVASVPALASPWAEVGDNQLRSDVELLQAAGVISITTMQWPLPWTSLASQLDKASLDSRSAAIRGAAARLLARAERESDPRLRASAYADITNRPSVVYSFDGMGRGDGQANLSISGVNGAFSGRLSAGIISQNFGGGPNKLMLDGTFGAVDALGLRLYAGYLDHWWGPGEISALQLSNNARPMPQVGIERSSTEGSSWPVLRWLGPWQFGLILATLDGPQKQSNVRYDAAHLTIEPLPGLELGVAKTDEFCGQGHPCAPLRDYFKNIDFSTHANNVNGEGSFEAKYSHTLGGTPFELHMQMMNEDYSLANSSGTSHLVGASVWLPLDTASPLKLTAEFTDSIATRTMLGFGNDIYGFTYNDYQYPDGMHYRDRTLGFSLDSDSTLLSLQGSWSDDAGRFYELSWHHATIGTAHTPVGDNTLSTAPVLLNLGEARVSLPWHGFRFDIAGRLQDDQPRPSRGFAAAIEVGLHTDL